MSAEPSTLASALAAAVGDDPGLLRELYGAFIAGARGHLDAVERAGSEPEWQAAAWRLHGLAASFGAIVLMDRATDVAATPGDVRTLARAHAALETLAG